MVLDQLNSNKSWKKKLGILENIYVHTVDGRNPAPVDMVNIPLFTGFHRISSINIVFYR